MYLSHSGFFIAFLFFSLHFCFFHCISLFLTPNSHCFSCWGVVKHSFILFCTLCDNKVTCFLNLMSVTLPKLGINLTICSFQPVLHDWCNKGCGMYYPVCGMVHIKETLLLIRKSSPCGGSGFPLSLSE